MPLPPLFQRKPKPAQPAPMAEEGPAVQQARMRARRRLVGAVVLLAAGILGFPLLFETQPRPLPVDLPIELARGDAAPPRSLRVPTPPPTLVPPADAGNESASAIAPASSPGVGSASGAASGPAAIPAPGPAPAPTPSPAPTQPADAAEPAPAPAAAKASAPVPPAKLATARPVASAPRSAEPAASADARSGRFVVQVGAYTDQGALREARQKVEKLGLKTYTQDIDTPSGKRTRLRVGPFTTHEQAEAAGARLKAIGLPGNLLSL